MDLKGKKQKRNKPCENCRMHRRKCEVNPGVLQCNRCIKTDLPCVFKFNPKPTALKKTIPVSKKNKLQEQVRVMQQQISLIENQLNLLKQQKAVALSQYDTPVMNSSTHKDQWKLTINHSSQGLSLTTSIKDFSDIAIFLSETSRYFTDASLLTPNRLINRSEQKLTITHKLLQVESMLHNFFKKKQPSKKPIVLFTSSHIQRTQFKMHLIQDYFSCAGLVNPIFSKAFYLPIFLLNPHSMISTAISALVAYTHCRHVQYVPPPMTREGWAESFRQEAKGLLQSVLLEQEPDILTAGTLFLLAQCALIALENNEARLYVSIAWRMVIELKDQYLPMLQSISPSTPVTNEVSIAESFRRMFYIIRYLELNLHMIYDGSADFSFALYDYGLGSPIVLGNEIDNFDALNVFRYVCQLHICQLPSDQLKFQLLAGSLDTIPVIDIERLEHQMINFWKSLPTEYRLSDTPLQYLQMDTIQQCGNPYAIYLNQLYYCYWLTLETRLMQSPSSTDLVGANMERFDGDRALMIVSVCCDAIAKIFHVLYSCLPCTVELHWLLIASDAMTMLKSARNTHISERAKSNLKITLNVLGKRVQQVSSQQDWMTMLPPSSPGSPCSDTTEGRPVAAYFDELEKTLYTCFEHY